MRLRQLEYFVAVCQAGSFTAAAGRLYVSQPSLSQQIRALERELGATLIERPSHGVQLTSAGRPFLDDAKRILEMVAQATDTVRGVAEGREGDLHVLTVRSVASGILPPTIVRWHSSFPGTVLRLHDFSHKHDLEEALRGGQGSLAVGPRPEAWTGPVHSLGYEEMVGVGQHEPTPTATIDHHELATRPWVGFESEQGMSEVLAWTAERLNFSPRIVARTGQVAAALLLAVEGVGMALVPENAVPAGWSQYARRLGPGVFRELVVYARTTQAQLSGKYWDLLTQIELPLLRAESLPPRALTL